MHEAIREQPNGLHIWLYRSASSVSVFLGLPGRARA